MADLDSNSYQALTANVFTLRQAASVIFRSQSEGQAAGGNKKSRAEIFPKVGTRLPIGGRCVLLDRAPFLDWNMIH